MEKLRVMQLPFIILLLLVIAVVFFQYQKVVEENGVLQLKLSESLTSPENSITPINVISDNSITSPHNDVNDKAELANINVENHLIEVQQSAITEVDAIQLSKNTQVIPFEYQEIDYQWAAVMENAVNDAFQTSELLEKFTLENVECRSSTCEVRMPKEQEDTFHQSVLVLFALDEIGVKHSSLKVSSDAEEGTVIFYFSKHES